MGNQCNQCTGRVCSEMYVEEPLDILSENSPFAGFEESTTHIMTDDGRKPTATHLIEERRKPRPDIPKLNLPPQPDSDLPRLKFGKTQTWNEMDIGPVLKKSISSMSQDGLRSLPSAPALTPPPVKSVGKLDANAPKARVVEVVFNTRRDEKTVQIFRGPLGAEFVKPPFGRVRISKVEPGSYAWGVGLEKGWILKRVDGEDMSKKTLEETQAVLEAAIGKLPQRA